MHFLRIDKEILALISGTVDISRNPTNGLLLSLGTNEINFNGAPLSTSSITCLVSHTHTPICRRLTLQFL